MIDLIKLTLASILIIIGTIGFVGLVLINIKLEKNKESIFLKYFIHTYLFATALGITLSGRNYQLSGEAFDKITSPVWIWTNRTASILAMTGSLIILINFLFRRKDPEQHSKKIMLSTIVIFWATTVGLPSFLPTHSKFEPSFIYPLFILSAVAVVNQNTLVKLIVATRNAGFAFLISGLFLIPIAPDLVIDRTYTQGYIPEMPRFSGLAPHPITLAALTATILFSSILIPFKNHQQQKIILTIGTIALLITQAKTIIAGYILMLIITKIYNNRNQKNIGHAQRSKSIFNVLLLSTPVIIVVFLSNIYSFEPDHSQRLATFTGRDVIWNVAIQEWLSNPIFGYGNQLFSTEHRALIGMSYATGGHNQVIDVLGRSGIIGLLGLGFFCCVLIYYTIRYRLTSNGLALGFLVLHLTRFVTEVPFSLGQISIDTICQVVLLSSIRLSFCGKVLGPVHSSQTQAQAR